MSVSYFVRHTFFIILKEVVTYQRVFLDMFFDAYKITVGLFVQLLFFKLSTVAVAVTTTATIVVVFGIATAAVAMPTAAIYV